MIPCVYTSVYDVHCTKDDCVTLKWTQVMVSRFDHPSLALLSWAAVVGVAVAAGTASALTIGVPVEVFDL